MKMFVKLPDHAPTLWDVPADLPTLQHIVGGYIESHAIMSDLLVLCNEEGRLFGLPANCEIAGIYFCGPIILAGYRGEELVDIKADERIMRSLFPKLWRNES